MNRSRRFRLGLLALLTVTTFVVMLTFVLQGVMREERASYFILFDENVKGMVVGSKVNFQGVPIGMVRDIRFQGGRTKVELSIDPHRAEIQDITKARLVLAKAARIVLQNGLAVLGLSAPERM